MKLDVATFMTSMGYKAIQPLASDLPLWIESFDALVEYCDLLRQENALLKERLLMHQGGERQFQAIDRFIRHAVEVRQERDLEDSYADRS